MWKIFSITLILLTVGLLAYAADDGPIARTGTQNQHFILATLGQFDGVDGGTRADSHLRFISTISSTGSNVTLDSSTTYTEQNNVASLGRFTLAAGHTYRLEFHAGLNAQDDQTTLLYNWYNADTGAPITSGIVALGQAFGAAFGSGSTLVTVFTATANTRVEIRIPTTTGFSPIIGLSRYKVDGGSVHMFPQAFVSQLY